MKKRKRAIVKTTINKAKLKHHKTKSKTKKLKRKKTIKKYPSLNSKKIERVHSGIPNFDNLIESGFKKNSTNIVVGNAGSGKTIFATQFLMEGLKKGESCLYVTFEEKKDQFYKDMSRFGWNLEEYEKKGKFNFLEYTPAKVKTMLEEGGGEVENLILTNKVTRMVIDSITSFDLLFKDELERREAALELFNMLKGWECTVIITLEDDPSSKESAAHSIEFETDSIILLYFVRKKNERERFIEILKMRGTKHSKKVYEFLIEKSGLTIKKTPSRNPPSTEK